MFSMTPLYHHIDIIRIWCHNDTMKKTIGIYKITNTVNNKIYIGRSAEMEVRWKCHRSKLVNSKHVNPHLQNAWNKYGGCAFVFEVIEIVAQIDNLQSREHYYIETMKPAYNKASSMRGANVGKQCSEHTKSLLRAKMIGKTVLPKTRAKISKSLKASPYHQARVKWETRHCDGCGSPVIRKPCRFNKCSVFCNYACFCIASAAKPKTRTLTVTSECKRDGCTNTFTKLTGAVKKYCSGQCKIKGNSIQRRLISKVITCIYCGATIKTARIDRRTCASKNCVLMRKRQLNKENNTKI